MPPQGLQPHYHRGAVNRVNMMGEGPSLQLAACKMNGLEQVSDGSAALQVGVHVMLNSSAQISDMTTTSMARGVRVQSQATASLSLANCQAQKGFVLLSLVALGIFMSAPFQGPDRYMGC